MSEIEAAIADAAAAVETERAKLEPLAAELIAAAGSWAADQWERIVGKVAAANPELVKASQAKLPALKERLRELQTGSAEVAEDHLQPWLLHRSLSDAQMLAFADVDRWGAQAIRVSLPRASTSKADEPLRRLAGAIGPALHDAAILTDDSEVDASGRYRYALVDESRVTGPLDAYEGGLKEFIRRLFVHQQLEHERNSDEATQLWRDA